jgi:hypothetical protein
VIHRAHEPIVKQGGTTYHFVITGLADALDQAPGRAAAPPSTPTRRFRPNDASARPPRRPRQDLRLAWGKRHDHVVRPGQLTTLAFGPEVGLGVVPGGATPPPHIAEDHRFLRPGPAGRRRPHAAGVPDAAAGLRPSWIGQPLAAVSSRATPWRVPAGRDVVQSFLFAQGRDRRLGRPAMWLYGLVRKGAPPGTRTPNPWIKSCY